jgi:methionyl aminopeptidase
MIFLKSKTEIDLMRKAGEITAKILSEMSGMLASGMTTGEIDQYAESRCKDFGVKPAFKGYQGYPASVCISVNNEVVHGIPSKKRQLKTGDIVSLDFGVIYEGYYGDSARTVAVGNIPPQTAALLEAAEGGLFAGISEARAGNRLFDISHAIQNYVESRKFSVVREFVGHGIGRHLHEEPQVPNFGPKGKGIPLREGMVIAIEPMVNMGGHAVEVLKDGWTAVTADGSLSAHFEHTVLIRNGEPEILTKIQH